MIITPAILTKTQEQLGELLQKYIDAEFDFVDIDIQETPFASDATIDLSSALEVVKSFTLPTNMSIGWDLKVTEPQQAVEQVIANPHQRLRIYVYQHANLEFLEDMDLYRFGIGLGVYPETELKEVSYYNKFPEVQFMTIDAEKQGAPINQDLLGRVARLRDMGYGGQISIDGGVNPDSAGMVKQAAPDRVSVGSFFQNSDSVVESKQQLERALL